MMEPKLKRGKISNASIMQKTSANMASVERIAAFIIKSPVVNYSKLVNVKRGSNAVFSIPLCANFHSNTEPVLILVSKIRAKSNYVLTLA